MKGLTEEDPQNVLCYILRRSLFNSGEARVGKGRKRQLSMTELVWQEVGILLASGAIGSLLTWGYQNWLKR
jgi:hypothetical protein